MPTPSPTPRRIVLQADQLAYQYADRPDPLFEGVDVLLRAGQHAALIGANGSGKTTLLRLLAGELEPTSGSLTRPAAIAVVGQHDSLDAAGSVRQALLAGVPGTGSLAAELAAAEAAGLPDPLRYADAMAAYGEAGGFALEQRLEAEAAALGFDALALAGPPGALSGGRRRLLRLLVAFLTPADLVLLDEPTNYLDEDARERLAALVGRSEASVLVVSHDRWFLDAVADTMLVLERGEVRPYRGNYSRYRDAREADRRWRERERGRLEGEIERLRQAERSYKIWGGRKEAEKSGAPDKGFIGARAARLMKRGILAKERLGDRREELEAKRPWIDKRYRIAFEDGPVPAGRCLTLQALRLERGGRVLLQGADAAIGWGEHVALTGVNGAGKSSLLEVLAGARDGHATGPRAGRVDWSAQARLGYLRQASTLDTRSTLAAAFRDDVGGEGTERAAHARRLLGAFGVPGEQFASPLAALSLGQRRKAELVRLILQRPNVLLLDEPTTHLDLPSIEMLEAALADFRGTLVLVSHDQALREAVTSRSLRLEEGGLRGEEERQLPPD